MDAHLLLPLLVLVAVGGVVYALVMPLLEGRDTASKRVAALQARSTTKASNRANDAAKRRKQVAESLKELDARAKSKKVSFEAKMAQAGLTWSKRNFYIASGVAGAIGAGVTFATSGSLLYAVPVGAICGLGLPAWVISFLRKRRMKQFLEEFPSAVDIIVRGIKAGIPLGDCVRVISLEANEPVRTEFRTIVEAQSMGLAMPEAVERLVERVPLAEANFFAIVINIQAKAGGNLAEALSNLSAVLRDRKKMKAKIKAMSSEAKASAGIIGALPPLVGCAVYWTSPDYVSLLFTTNVGHLVLGGCVLWMGTGVFMMKKMINFDL